MRRFAFIMLAAACIVVLAGCSSQNNSTEDLAINQDSTQETATMTAILKTNFGDITVELFDEETQKTVENFVQLAGVHFYDGTQFHRVIPGFMIQGGDPNTIRYPDNLSMHGRGDPGYKFEDEITERKLVRGSLAMANSGPNTNGSQFFIVTAEATPWLDGLHTNFGKVVAGMDVVDRIEAVERDANDHPIQPVVLNSTEIVVGE